MTERDEIAGDGAAAQVERFASEAPAAAFARLSGDESKGLAEGESSFGDEADCLAIEDDAVFADAGFDRKPPPAGKHEEW